MAASVTAPAGLVVLFGPFRLFPAQRLLLQADQTIHLGSHALDILIALVERAGETVTKDELKARVWPEAAVVEEGTLRVHVAALRRTLGGAEPRTRYIATVPGRGYCFAAPVTRTEGPAPARPTESKHNLPTLLTRVIGREDTIKALASRLVQQRLLTIVGVGGIGKTTVALAVATELIDAFRDGVWFVDLVPLSDEQLMASGIAAALRLEGASEHTIGGLIGLLHDKQMLLVLDNCEHVIEAAAAFASQVLKKAPGVHILATSREPLLVQSENVYRLPPLAIPSSSARLSAADLLRFPAVQLFIERAAGSLGGPDMSDAEALVVAEICRKLDGIALAIELAAARVEVFGVRGLAVQLNNRFRLLTRGGRTAPQRHQTLRAMLDWSYELLSQPERAVLRRLSIFAAAFTLEAAGAVAAANDMAAIDVAECIAGLVTKSLVVVDRNGALVYYRLLDTVRAYAREKLLEGDDGDRVARYHAVFFRDLFDRTEAEWETEPSAEWLAAYRRQIDDVRIALDWAFSPGGNISIGVALTVATVSLWVQLGLLDEYRGRVEQALDSTGAGLTGNAYREMELRAALGLALMHTKGSVAETGATWAKVLHIAEDLHDKEYQLHATAGIWSYSINSGEYRAALAQAQRFATLATSMGDPFDLLIGDRMVGISLHYRGDQSDARKHIERSIGHHTGVVHRSRTARFLLDQLVAARTTLARILWVQGYPDQAMRMAERTVEDARADEHVLSLCYALGRAACPVALYAGDQVAAERFVLILLEESAKHALRSWHARGRCLKGVLLTMQGDAVSGSALLRAALEDLRETGMASRYTAFMGLLAQALGDTGKVGQAFATIEEALTQSERNEERWYIAELLRIKGKLELKTGVAEAATRAEDYFQQALGWARRQEALSWELRAATSLTRLWIGQGRAQEARDLLQSVYGRFSEGFGTADLVAAKGLLDKMGA